MCWLVNYGPRKLLPPQQTRCAFCVLFICTLNSNLLLICHQFYSSNFQSFCRWQMRLCSHCSTVVRSLFNHKKTNLQQRALSGAAMRLVQFHRLGDNGGIRVGVEQGEGLGVVDLKAFDPSMPSTMKELLELGDKGLECAERYFKFIFTAIIQCVIMPFCLPLGPCLLVSVCCSDHTSSSCLLSWLQRRWCAWVWTTVITAWSRMSQSPKSQSSSANSPVPSQGHTITSSCPQRARWGQERVETSLKSSGDS